MNDNKREHDELVTDVLEHEECEEEETMEHCNICHSNTVHDSVCLDCSAGWGQCHFCGSGYTDAHRCYFCDCESCSRECGCCEFADAFPEIAKYRVLHGHHEPSDELIELIESWENKRVDVALNGRNKQPQALQLERAHRERVEEYQRFEQERRFLRRWLAAGGHA